MKDKILAALGFPPPALLNRVTTAWGNSFAVPTDNLLVVDGREVRDEAGLKRIFQQLQSGTASLKANGKVVLLTLDPKQVSDVQTKTFQRAIEGIMRSLAKELGAKGRTVNLLRVDKSTTMEELAFPLAFFGSGRSSFITGQAVGVSGSPRGGSLHEKVCVVTGGAGGIGSETVKRLAADGATVIIADMPQMEERAKPILNNQIHFFGGDLTKDDQIDGLLAYVKTKFGRLDVLVNNAGITRDKTLAKMPEHFWDQLIAINLTAVMRLTEKALEQGLLPNDGRIINTSSISGIAGNFGQTNYTATKAALIAFGEGLGHELSAKGITVNAIAPGYIETDMVKTMPFMTRMFAERLTSLAQGGKPSDIAEAVAFLAHPGAQGISGQVLRVCGGSFLGA